MARMWLEMGSRFELYPEDLNTLNNNTDLNIASKETCFTKAAEYARKVINESGAMPLTEKGMVWWRQLYYRLQQCTNQFMGMWIHHDYRGCT